MEICHYTEVPTDKNTDEVNEDNETSWKHLFRQIIISSGIWGCYFIYGTSIGAITVFVPQIRREENSAEAVTPEIVSWLAATFGFAAIPWIFILSAISYRFGRRTSFRLISVVTFIASIIFYCSTNVVHILISEILISIIAAGQITVFIVIIAEYTSPRYRGFFLTMKSASFNWGIWISNAIGTFFYWKYIGIVQIICSSYILLTAIYWPESPYWLASKGKYEECTNTYHWLSGRNKGVKNELEHIISTKSDIANSNTITKKADNIYTIISSKKIYKPVLLIMILYCLYYSTGKSACMVYSIDIIKVICNSESVAYTVMLILDGFTVLCMYIGCMLSKIVSRRLLLFSSSAVGLFFLFIVSIYLYLIRFSVINENKYITTCLLLAYSIGISIGPFLLCTSISSELFPFKCRNTVIFGIGLYERLILGIQMKIIPNIFSAFGTHGTFLFFAVSSTICVLLLYKYLPETKDKTLHEIERLIINGSSKTDAISLNRPF